MTDPPRDGAVSWSDRLVGRLVEARSWTTSPRVSRVLLVVSVVVLVAGVVVAARSLDLPASSIDWTWVWVNAALVVPALALNGLEVYFAASVAGVSTSFRAAVRAAVLANTANLIPAPGGAAYRTVFFNSLGASLKRAAGANVLVAGAWLSATALLVSPGLLAVDRVGFAAVGGTVAGLLGVISYRGIRKRSGGVVSAALVLLELVFVLVGGLRILAALHAVGEPTSLLAALTIAAGPVVGAVAGFTPAGLGVAELAGTGFAVLVGVSASAGFLALTISRLASMAVYAAVASLLSALPRADTPA